ncbi:glycosyltransferase family 4 protein [Hyphomicrobium sp.]|uniref:glycosyltransferase family 4 protein n=1 Tax=Hyphomicrobium sp. TaxID=82 RepID=UPI002E365FFB|nr:glycosyltransferase family 4 protein [Hyphomicrobium sp.]HEX2842506.1 glycosyltransferase family 4 protein [Hyphomicrobium sp.]
MIEQRAMANTTAVAGGRALERKILPSSGSIPAEAESSRARDALHVAYLINQYPKASHAFIRREIQALEQQGVRVDRLSLRGWNAPLADPADILERQKTRFVLKEGVLRLLWSTVSTAISRPRQFVAALRETLSFSRKDQRSLPYHLAYLAEACVIAHWLAQSGATHLHAHFGTNSAEIAYLVHALGGPPYSFTVHGPEEFDRGPSLRLDKKIANAKFVAAISSYGRSQLFRVAAQNDWKKIKVVHCGLDGEFYRDAPAAAAPTRRFVCVGRLCEQKGQLLLLDAFREIVQRHPGCELVLAGGGEMRASLEARVKTLRLARAVRITGEISSAQVREEILAARALVLPSFQEGLPVVLMEAMALRRPVISTYIAGIPELVESGKSGWLVPAGSLDDLVSAMEACLACSDAELERMGARGYARATERHAIVTEAAKLATLFCGADEKAAVA